MSTINKQLYDALLAAHVKDDLATKAAESVTAAQPEITNMREDIAEIKAKIALVETRMALVEKLQWLIVAGILGLLIRAFIA